MEIPSIDNLQIYNIPYISKKIFNIDDKQLILYGKGFFKKWDNEFVKCYNIYIVKLLKNDLFKDFVSKSDNKIRGIFPLPEMETESDKEYSFLNKMTSHYTAFSILINFINIESFKKSQQQILFNDDLSNWHLEMKRFIPLCSSYKNIIFNDKELVFTELYNSICKSHIKGEKSEEKVKKLIEKILPNAKDFEKGGLGIKSDMVDGIDLSFTLNGRKMTLQNKKCGNIDYDDINELFIIKEISGVKEYNTSFLSFEDNNGYVYLFNNKNVKFIHNENLNIIPKRNLYYTQNKEYQKLQFHKHA